MKSKVEHFIVTSTSTPLTPPGPFTGEITGPLPLFFSWPTLAGLTQLTILCSFSTGPEKTREQINQLTLSKGWQPLAVI